MNDKEMIVNDNNVGHKEIEEMAKDLKECLPSSWYFLKSVDSDTYCVVKHFYNAGYRKHPKNSVVIPKEVSCYENIERAVRTFRLDGSNVDFTNEQIMALTQIFHIKERNENEMRKETAREILSKLYNQSVISINGTSRKDCSIEVSFENLYQLAKQFGVEIKE